MSTTLYQAKRILRAPRTAYMRHKERDQPALARSMLEQHAYGRAMYRFMEASAANPDLLVEAALDSNSVVVDAGAFEGEWAERISDRYGATIYAFEPNPRSAERCRDRLAARSNVHVLEHGLGGADADASIGLMGLGSSIYGAPPGAATADIRVRDVVAVLDELHLERIDLLKVNIEGAEYDLFDRLIDADRLADVHAVSVQFHEWHPNAHRRRRHIRRALRDTHSEVWNYPWVWELWRRTGAQVRELDALGEG